MRIYFDCHRLGVNGAICKRDGHHNAATVKLYTARMQNGRNVIIKCCEYQATHPELFGWLDAKLYTPPTEGVEHCKDCGKLRQEGVIFCSNGVCRECCNFVCRPCTQCQQHTVIRGSCPNALCATCCGRTCTRCARCNNHATERCRENSLCRTCCNRNCPICQHCGIHSSNRCPHCNSCRATSSRAACCACRICRECSRMGACACRNCRSHCQCEARRNMSRTDYGMPFVAKRMERKLFDCSRLVGVEWEYNNAVSNTALSNWKTKWHGQIVSDGSCGQEVVTPPAAGDHLVNCLKDLGNAFVADRAEIDDRCGIHVHVDAADLSWYDMRRLLTTYAHVEPLLYLLAGQNRITNRYCVPCGETYVNAMGQLPKQTEINAVEERIRQTDASLLARKLPPLAEQTKRAWREKVGIDAMKGGILEVAFNQRGDAARQHQRGKPGKKDGARYKGLNLCPWLAGRRMKAKDTTIEFRLHRNVKGPDFERVINWAKVCARLVDWSVKASDNDVKQLPKSALKSLCKVIAPECEKYIVERVKFWRMATSVKLGTKRKIYLKDGKYIMRLKDT